MTTFEEFWKEYEESSDLLSLEGLARWTWEEAVLAERKRCAEVCRDLHSHYGVHDYHGLLLEASRAIRNT